MQTRFHDYKGITFGYTTPVSAGGLVSVSIIEIPQNPTDDWPNLPKYNSGGLIESHLKEVIPQVFELLDLEFNRLKQMTGLQKLSVQWFYFSLNKQVHPILILS